MKLLFIFVVPLALLFPRFSQACACCADVGEWSRTSMDLSRDAEMENRFSVLEAAYLGGFFQTVGEGDGPGRHKAARIGHAGKDIVLWLKPEEEEDPAKSAVSLLTFRRSGKVDQRMMDVEINPKNFKQRIESGKDVGLYHEIVIYGSAKVKGPLTEDLGTKPVPAVLILQGFNNHCQMVDDYRTWKMVFEGGRDLPSFMGMGEIEFQGPRELKPKI